MYNVSVMRNIFSGVKGTDNVNRGIVTKYTCIAVDIGPSCQTRTDVGVHLVDAVPVNTRNRSAFVDVCQRQMEDADWFVSDLQYIVIDNDHWDTGVGET